MTKCIKNVVYIGLEDIKNNGVSDSLKKESTRLFAPQAKKLQSIDELFLAAKRGIKGLYEDTLRALPDEKTIVAQLK